MLNNTNNTTEEAMTKKTKKVSNSRRIANRLIARANAYHEGRIDHETFTRRNRIDWALAERYWVEQIVRDLVS